MTSPHRALAIGLVALSPLVLAGCEKPYPGVTVWSGTSSEHASALCWQFEEGASLGPRDCAEDVLAQAGSGEGITRLEVSPGATVGISVDPVVADGGWSIIIGGQALPNASNLTDTYYRFPFPWEVAAEGPGFTMQIVAAAKPNGARGYWFFQLVPR